MEKPTVKSIPQEIIEEIRALIENKDYGSIEIYVEEGKVVQITDRTIRKKKSFL